MGNLFGSIEDLQLPSVCFLAPQVLFGFAHELDPQFSVQLVNLERVFAAEVLVVRPRLTMVLVLKHLRSEWEERALD